MSALGFIGTGTMGAPIARRLLDKGHALRVFDRAPDATAPLEDAGARRAANLAEIAAHCSTVLLSLPGPPAIEAVVLGEDGLLAHARALTTIVDLSTNAVALNRRIADAAGAQGIDYLDAPVSGGKTAARDGSLAVMVGGEQAAFETVRPLIECFGTQIFYMGGSGAGTLTKLVNNQIFLCASVLIQEGFVMGAKAGMDPGALLAALEASSAGPLVARAPLVLSRKHDRGIFALAIAAKDVAVALESGRALGCAMPLTEAAAALYDDALAQGLGAEDFYATLKVLEARAGVTLPPLARPKGGTA